MERYQKPFKSRNLSIATLVEEMNSVVRHPDDLKAEKNQNQKHVCNFCWTIKISMLGKSQRFVDRTSATTLNFFCRTKMEDTKPVSTEN